MQDETLTFPEARALLAKKEPDALISIHSALVDSSLVLVTAAGPIIGTVTDFESWTKAVGMDNPGILEQFGPSQTTDIPDDEWENLPENEKARHLLRETTAFIHLKDAVIHSGGGKFNVPIIRVRKSEVIAWLPGGIEPEQS